MISTEVHIPVHGEDTLPGILTIPTGAKGLVLFAHGSGSSRLSPRNNFVAGVLHKKNIATLLFDLLTEQEDQVYEQRFDIPLLPQFPHLFGQPVCQGRYLSVAEAESLRLF